MIPKPSFTFTYWAISTLAATTLVGCGGTGANDDRGSDDDTDSIGSLTETSAETETETGTADTSTTSTSETSDTQTDTGGEPCGLSLECPDGLYCIDGICGESEGECETHDDCDGDTYCCDAPDCLPEGEEPGICIPFGTGPFGDGNPECEEEIVIGLFEPDVQCEWTEPAEGDPFPDHRNVLTTPMVADLPYDSGFAGEIVIVTYNFSDGGAPAGWGSDPNYYGVIRVLNGDNCELIANIHDPANAAVAASPPAIGDLDGDGIPEIVTQRAVTGLITYHWDALTQTYTTLWTSAGQSDIASQSRWDGPALHDLDGDGLPEVISGSEVYDGATGVRLNPGQVMPDAGAMRLSVVGDLDHDFVPELISDAVYAWNLGTDSWEFQSEGGPGGTHYAFADFGSPGLNPGEWNADVFDNIAEIVTVGNGSVSLHTLEGEQLMYAADGILGGGPPTIGDFDNDGRPEIASAGGQFYRVFDLDCDGGDPSCAGAWVRWIQPSQDLSSRNTGSSIFDFEGDGEAEAIYGDECFLRVYKGSTGDVLYSSARTSCTWYENPVVADPDNDDNTEILVGSNSNCAVSCPELDPIHEGTRCEDSEDCVSGVCDEGFCRCADDLECAEGHACSPALAQTPGVGEVCRATHPPGIALTGVRVLRDRLDRWASSRNLWNQHAYSITNINDDLSIPDSATWALTQNYSDPELNNYRQNRQGDTPPEALPDITGELDDAVCSIEEGQTVLTGLVCNRGKKAVGSTLPATFYLGDPADNVILCVAYTQEPVPVDECREVSCLVANEIEGLITMVTNDDGMGGKTTLECFDNNNSDTIEIDACIPVG